MNLSNKINDFIQNYEYLNFSNISFGEVLYYMVRDNDLKYENEEECCRALEDLKEDWLGDVIRETTSTSTLKSIFKREAKTIEDIEKVVSEEFEIFEVNVKEHGIYNNRFEIKYYRTPANCDERHYIRVTVLTEPDFSTIKKILGVEKGYL